jgi:hypothetical protein
MKTMLAVAALAGISLIVPPSKQSSQRMEYYWYHPEGKACPAYQYSLGAQKEEEAAKKQCEQDSHQTCVKMHGTAAPACLR